MLTETEREALFILNRIPGMYRKRLAGMLDYAGSFCEALRIPEAEYYSQGIFRHTKNVPETGTFETMRQNRTYIEESLQAYHALESGGIRMIDYTEEAMPKRLSAIPDPPFALFVRGKLPEDSIPSASIIGSRQCSAYGSDVASFFGRELAKAGVQIISGMAMGIDSFGLSGALEGSGTGYAVLGSGVDVCYPPSSETIYRQMRSGKGGIISEFAPDAPAIGYHFVLRNRLISALGDVLVVIEAASKSGTSITVGAALEQGKDVFALPGRITDPLGRGCNQLIRDGAFPLTEPQDILRYLGITEENPAKTLKEKAMNGLSEEEKGILRVMSSDPMHVEDIAEKVSMDVSKTIHLLSMLELHGNIRSHGGAYYSKIYR